jgi:hypothetical protein
MAPVNSLPNSESDRRLVSWPTDDGMAPRSLFWEAAREAVAVELNDFEVGRLEKTDLLGKRSLEPVARQVETLNDGTVTGSAPDGLLDP